MYNPFKNGDERPEELGYLFVVGGPGGSGVSTIARALAKHFGLGYVYTGKIMREIAEEKGFDQLIDFLESDYFKDDSYEIDKKIDMRTIKLSMQPNVLLDSKNFAALATSNKIPCTVKIWLDASLTVRVTRALMSREGLKKSERFDIDREAYEDMKERLVRRYESDKIRFRKLYDIDYDRPEVYNNIVLDTSGFNEHQTFNLILNRINKYVRGEKAQKEW